MSVSKAAFVRFLRESITDDDVLRLWNGGHVAMLDEAVPSAPEEGAAEAKPNGSPAKKASAGAKKLLPIEKVEELVLKALAKGGLQAKPLAGKSGGNQDQVVRVVRKLEKAGKVFRAGDRRYTCYALTQEAANAAEKKLNPPKEA